MLVVPSMGSSAISKRGEFLFPLPSLSPRKMPGALSFIPSPITTSPRISTRSKTPLIASQAAWSAASLFPRPSQWMAFNAAFSVARTNSNSTVRSMSCKLSIAKASRNYKETAWKSSREGEVPPEPIFLRGSEDFAARREPRPPRDAVSSRLYQRKCANARLAWAILCMSSRFLMALPWPVAASLSS